MPEDTWTRLGRLEGKFEVHTEHTRRWQEQEADKTQRILDKLEAREKDQDDTIRGIQIEVAETRGRDRNIALFGSVALSAAVAWASHKLGLG